MSIKSLFAIIFYLVVAPPITWALPAQPTPPAATNATAARLHVDRGLELFKRKTPQDLESAIAEFTLAYDASPESYFLINIGRCYHHLGKPEEAQSYYQRARQQLGEVKASQDARLQRYEEEAKALLLAKTTAAPPTLSVAPTSAPALSPAQPLPLHRRWGLWLGVGLGTAAAIGLGLGLGLGLQGPSFVTLTPQP